MCDVVCIPQVGNGTMDSTYISNEIEEEVAQVEIIVHNPKAMQMLQAFTVH